MNALDLLEECYEEDEEKTTTLITTSLSTYLSSGTTCLELAVSQKHQEFVAHSCAQYLLTDVWTGKMKLQNVTKRDYMKILIAICFPILINNWFKFQIPPHLQLQQYNNMAKQYSSNKKTTGQYLLCSFFTKQYWKNIFSFYTNTPVVRYLLHLVAYIIFLILYVYVILNQGVRLTHITTSEMLLYIFGAGHLTSEIYQITQYREKGAFKKMKIWISDKYNVCDLILLTTFVLAFIFHMINDTVDISHTIHSVTCGLWILRITTALRVSAVFGAYLEMIFIMMGNLKDFLLILLIAILAYGVMATSLLYPAADISTQLETVLIRPWFHIYGDNYVEMEASGPNMTHYGTPKVNEYAEYIVWLLQIFYLILTNILLLNVIIAVFNSSYKQVIQQGSKTWKFQRYHMVVEYSQRLTAPPPLCIVPHLYLLFRKILNCCFCGKLHLTEWSNEEFKREPVGEDEKVELAQFECDCAMAIHMRRRNVTDRRMAGADYYLAKSKKRKVAGLDSGVEKDEEMKELKETMAELQRELQRERLERDKSVRDMKTILNTITHKIDPTNQHPPPKMGRPSSTPVVQPLLQYNLI